MEQLIIQSDRLLIRNLKLTDLEAFHSYRSDPEVLRYQGMNAMTVAEAETFINKQKDKLFGKAGEWVQYALEHKTLGHLIGDCAIKLQADDPRIAEVGMTIHPDFQRKGFAKEAMLAVMHFLFEVKNLHRIVETVDAENIASIRLLKSLQFRQEGHFIENIFFNGKWGSEFQYAMLRSEFTVLFPHFNSI